MVCGTRSVAVKFICLTRSLNFIEIFYIAIRCAVRVLTDPKRSSVICTHAYTRRMNEQEEEKEGTHSLTHLYM